MDVPLPKKPLTWAISLVHITWIVGVMWLGPFIVPQKYRVLWLGIMIANLAHWSYASGECILSYLEKKAENNSYKLGDNPELTYAWVILGRITGMTMLQLRKMHAAITNAVFTFVLADQILVYNPLNIDYSTRVGIFVLTTVLTQKCISFDSFNNIANDLK